MRKVKKASPLEVLKEKANSFLRDSVNQCRSDRQAVQVLVTSVLMETNRYHGFRYLTAEQVPAGHSVGIIFDISPEAKHQFPDETRIAFY